MFAFCADPRRALSIVRVINVFRLRAFRFYFCPFAGLSPPGWRLFRDAAPGPSHRAYRHPGGVVYGELFSAGLGFIGVYFRLGGSSI